MDGLGELELLDALGRELRPGRGAELTREVLEEGLEVATLVVGEGVDVLSVEVFRHLVDGDVELLLAEAGDLALDLWVLVDDLLAAHLPVDGLDEAVEGDGGLGADEAEAQGIEEGTIGLVDHFGLDEGGAEALPRTTRGRDGAGFGAFGGVEPLLVLFDEGHDVVVDGTGLLGPGHPVGHGGRQVDGPESIEQGRVHLIDGIRGRRVDRRVDPRLGV